MFSSREPASASLENTPVLALPSIFPRRGKRRALRPQPQMAFATWTVRTAEAFQGHGKSGQFRVQRAFVAAGNRPGAKRFSGAGQLIDMPMRKLFSPHVAGDPRREPARPPGRAAINVTSGRQNRGVSAGLDGQRRVELDQQRIGAFFARGRRRVDKCDPHACSPCRETRLDGARPAATIAQ